MDQQKIQKLRRLEAQLADYTVVIEVGSRRITDVRRGVKPVMAIVDSGESIEGAIVADRVVGKAVALLYAGLKISAVYARVISEPAKRVLTSAGIYCEHGQLVDYIVNRAGDGKCPMESAVMDIEDFDGAVYAIRNQLRRLEGGFMKKLGFGLMRMPLLNPDDRTSVDVEQVCAMTDTFLSRGFTYFDTAYMYHDFKSEFVVRDALVKRYDRHKFLLADKLPSMFLKQEGDPEKYFTEQLGKCGVDYFDYYLIHCLDKDNYAKAEKFGAFQFAGEMKKAGKIKKLGFSFHDSAEMLKKIISDHPEVDFVQLQLNYLDWEDKTVQSRACYEVARSFNKDIIVMEPIKGGTLATVPEEAARLLKEADASLTPAMWALRFVASLEGVIMILSGMSDYSQLDQNTTLFDAMKPLTEKERALLLGEVTAIIKRPQSIACTGCSYCTDGCPKKIDIPAVFSAWNTSLTATGIDLERAEAEYAIATETRGKASECIACRKCEGICPQKLPIVKNLKNVAKMLEK